MSNIFEAIGERFSESDAYSGDSGEDEVLQDIDIHEKVRKVFDPDDEDWYRGADQIYAGRIAVYNAGFILAESEEAFDAAVEAALKEVDDFLKETTPNRH